MMLGDNVGRRRITQLSKDEWRAALEQQIAEKQQSKQRQRDTSPDSSGRANHANDVGTRGNQEPVSDAAPPPDIQPEDTWGRSNEWAGRRGVQQMSNEEWKQALELQIQAKKQQKEQNDSDRGAGSRRRVSASAPTTEVNNEQSFFTGEKVAPPSSANAGTASAGGRRRVTQLSQEEYLKSVQEQIEQKRLAKEREKAQRAESPVKSIVVSEPTAIAAVEAAAVTPAAENVVFHSNQMNQNVQKPAEVGSDPIAIATIVSFYEELKKQNEDVKQHLVEQHSVLASLQNRLVTSSTTTDISSEQPKPTEGRSKIKSLEVRVAGARPIRAAALRPRVSRGESKIPLPPSLQAAASNAPDTIPLIEKSSTGHSPVGATKPLESNIIPTQQPDEDKQEKDTEPQHDSYTIPRKAKIHNQEEPITPEQTADYGEKPTTNEASNQEKEENNVAIHELNIAGDIESPMTGDSELVSETDRISLDGELLSCTSTCVFDGPSSLVALDTSMAEIFRSSH